LNHSVEKPAESRNVAVGRTIDAAISAATPASSPAMIASAPAPTASAPAAMVSAPVAPTSAPAKTEEIIVAPVPEPTPEPMPAPVSKPTKIEKAKIIKQPKVLAPIKALVKLPDDENFYLNVGLFADDNNALNTHVKLTDAGLASVQIEMDTPKGKRTRVRVGPFDTLTEADKAAKKIRAMGLEAVLVRP
jgi:DedD protein